ncbi:MAG: hypothetical protein CMJ83_06270 [Planctomycetes bacterium]|nr:hypothetical protein [Planctomycetota bacterium]
MTSMRALGLVLLLACVAGMAWWMLQGGDDDPALGWDTVGRPMASETETSETDGDLDPATDVDTVPVDTSPYVDGDAARRGAGIVFMFQDEAEAPQQGVTVECTYRGSNLRFYGIGRSAEKNETPPWAVLHTDGRGEAYLAKLPPGGLRIVGTKQELLGFLDLGAGKLVPGTRHVVKMKKIRPVVVTVVDKTGNPVPGAPVEPAQSQHLAQADVAWSTRPDGVAHLSITPMDTVAYGAKKFTPQVRLPSGTVKGKPVDWAEEGPTEATVEVPNGAYVLVKVVDGEGRPSFAKRKVRWSKQRKGGNRTEAWGLSMSYSFGGFGGQQRNPRERSFTGSETMLGGFKEGAKLTLELEEPGRCDVTQDLTLTPGVMVHEITFEQGPPVPMIEIPLVDPRGLAVTEGRFKLIVTKQDGKKPDPGRNGHLLVQSLESRMVVYGGGATPGVVRTPSQRGIVRIEAQPHQPIALKVTRQKESGLGLWYGMRSKDKDKPLLDTKLTPLDPGEIRRLDPLIVPDLPVIVAGQVVDEDDQPVPGALIRIAPGPADGDAWRNDRMVLLNLKVRTDSDGRFMIRGENGEEGWSVFARLGQESRTAFVPFDLGQADVQLRLHAAGVFVGNLVAALPGTKVQVTLEPEKTGINSGLSWLYPSMEFLKTCDKKGNFRFEGLAPGRYRVTVRMARHAVLRVNGILVEGGKENRDPRLDGTTVGAELEKAWITVRHPDGSPVKGAALSLTAPKGETGPRESRRTDAEGKAHVILPRGARRSVKVTAKNFLPWNRHDCLFPLDVTLDPGCAVSVEITADGAPPPVTDRVKSWRVSLARADAKGSKTQLKKLEELAASREIERAVFERISFRSSSSMGGKSTSLDKLGRATLKGVHPGRYIVTVRPRIRRTKPGGKSSWVSGPSIPLGEIDVPTGVWEKTFVLAADPVKIAKALE